LSFTVKALRELFSFPGQPDDREVDVVIAGESIPSISGPSPELGTSLEMTVDLGPGLFLTNRDPNKIAASNWLPPEVIGDFANKWVVVALAHGADFGKFVPDENASGTFYDAAGEALKTWPQWVPLPEGTAPDPHLATTPPEPPSAPLTVTILRPITDPSTLGSMLMFELAKSDGFTLTSPAQPEWNEYERRANAALTALRNVDQLRSLLPDPVNP
jgi:hypothetical protein